MRMLKTLLTLVTAGFLPSSPLHAESAPIRAAVAGRQVQLILPPGACAYDPANPVDAQVLNLLKKGNEHYNDVLLAFADCGDLENMRQGKRVAAAGDYGQILSPLAAKDMAHYLRAEIVSNMTEFFRKQTGIFEDSSQKAKEIIDSASKGTIRLDAAKMLGILHSEGDFVQVGLLETMHMPDKDRVLAGVITTTKLGGPVTINLYHTFTDGASLKNLTARSASYTRALVALNPDNSSSQAPPADALYSRALLTAAVIGALVMIGAFALFAAKRKRK